MVGTVRNWRVGGAGAVNRPRFNATLRDRIAQVVGDRILTGELADGVNLDLEELAEEFGTSTTPVREGLLKLAHDGLVEIVPRRAVTVRGLSPDQLRDNFEVFGALAGAAAAWAARREGPDLAARLRGITAAFDADASPEDLIAANWEFHREINLASGSSRLIGLIRQMSRLVPAGYFDMSPAQASVSSQEHGELTDAIEARDGDRARRITERHLSDAGEAMALRFELARPGG